MSNRASPKMQIAGDSAGNLFSFPGVVYTTGIEQWDKAIVTIRNGIRTP